MVTVIDRSWPVRFSFSLTFFQRVFDPPERLIFAGSGFWMLAIGLFGIVFAPNLQRIVISVLVVIGLLIFRKPLHSLLLSGLQRQHINTVEFTEEHVRFGVNGLQAQLSRKPFKASRGLFGTLIMRHPLGYSLVLPKEAISLAELKQLIEI
jgi:hypothetical protein